MAIGGWGAISQKQKTLYNSKFLDLFHKFTTESLKLCMNYNPIPFRKVNDQWLKLERPILI